MKFANTLEATGESPLLATRRIDLRRCTLVVESGPNEGRTYGPLGEITVIGREPWCDLALDDGHVSKEHCELLLMTSDVRLRDLDSRNGTFCEGMRVFDVMLPADGRFRVGKSTLRVVFEHGSWSVTRGALDPTKTLVGCSDSMRRLFAMMERVASRDIPVLMLGETGTGKTAIARTMHAMSPRSAKPFVSINCAALPADLVETTLFGHVKGAFTGAHRSTAGIFEQASGGSVLLDEIGDMPSHLQAKLLSVLETRRVRPVGAEREIPVDFRLFTATHRKLDDDGKRLRRDLFYRIAGIELSVPPLRERAADLPALVDWFMMRSVDKLGGRDAKSPLRGISPEALAVLERHNWPGNVRELENVIDRAVALAESDLLEPSDILLSTWGSDSESLSAFDSPGDDDGGAESGAVGAILPFKVFKSQLLAEHERAYLGRLLAETGGNITHAAQAAGLSRTYLKLMMSKYGL